jgi:hypothetical protein
MLGVYFGIDQSKLFRCNYSIYIHLANESHFISDTVMTLIEILFLEISH